MGRFLALLLTILALAQPALAQRIIVPAAPSGANPNPVEGVSQSCGWTAAEMTTVTAGSANTKGSATATMCTTSADGTGLAIYISTPNAGPLHYLFDVSVDDGSTWALQNLYWGGVTTTSQALTRYFIPLRTTAGAKLKMRSQSNSGSATFIATIDIIAGQAGSGYATCSTIATSAGSSTANNVDITAKAAGGTFDTLIASTAQPYKWLMFTASARATTPTTGQRVQFEMATGVATSEVVFFTWPGNAIGADGHMPRSTSGPIAFNVNSGERISARALAGTQGVNDIWYIQTVGCF